MLRGVVREPRGRVIADAIACHALSGSVRMQRTPPQYVSGHHGLTYLNNPGVFFLRGRRRHSWVVKLQSERAHGTVGSLGKEEDVLIGGSRDGALPRAP
eukprot:scaffold202575_cov31-Tisochrysis_lutea.AAC.1